MNSAHSEFGPVNSALGSDLGEFGPCYFAGRQEAGGGAVGWGGGWWGLGGGAGFGGGRVEPTLSTRAARLGGRPGLGQLAEPHVTGQPGPAVYRRP